MTISRTARLLAAATTTLALLGAGCASAPPQQAVSPVPAAVAPAVDPQAEGKALDAWFETQFEAQLQDSPMTLTMLGRKDQYDKLDDVTLAEQDRQLAKLAATVQDMESRFRYDRLDAEHKLSFDLWKFQYEQAAEAAKWRDSTYVFTQMQGVHTFLATFMINFHKVDTPEDMQAYITRLEQFDDGLTELVNQAKARAANGVRPPRFAYETVLKESRALISGAPFDRGKDNALWADAKGKIAALKTAGKIDDAGAAALEAKAKAALLGPVKSGYGGLIAFMREDMPKAPIDGAVGVGRLPNGAAFYASRLKAMTTTDLTPDQVHEIGLAEVARIRGEMEAIKTKVGFKGDLNAFFKHVQTMQSNFYPNTDAGRQAYLDDATAAIENIKKQLPNYFGLLPKGDLVVRRVEAFREQPGAAQHYFQGTPDGSRPGIYYVHLIDMKANPKNELEDIAYHEGLPGHHMQIAIAQELKGVPTFRTQAGFGAYQEGWALYAEYLAKEMPGTYADPYSDFGRLSNEMWRAVRLVLDTGIHAKGWTEKQANEYFAANTATTPAAIKSEVRRYIVWPGQASSYKVGMLKILELRAKAKAELGDKFDIRAFHDVVLGGGALPLSLLERRVNDWIAKTKAG